MRKTFLFIVFLYSAFFGVGQSNIDVLHYKFKISLNDANDTIHGVAEIKVRFLGQSSDVTFDLASLDAKNKGMKVGKVQGNNVRGMIHNEEKLRIILSKSSIVNDTATFIIPYAGIPADGLIIDKTKYGRRCFFADNWPDRGHNWIPCHDDPADKATVEFIVTAPEHYKVVANGVQIEEKKLPDNFKSTHWKEEVPISTKVMVIGVADFAVDLAGTVAGVPIYSWVYPENKEDGFYEYAIAKDILPFFIDRVGPYGYKKLANVQSKTRFGGLENANTIFYSESSVTGVRGNERLITHEIAHQWFGNMATEKCFGHLWLSEGFSTYFAILYFENKYGKDAVTKVLKEHREEVIAYSKETNKPVVDTSETNYMRLLNPNSYQKGSWVLHMLRKELGDSVFWRSIRKYYATYAGSVADTRDVQKIFETVSGKNLEQFFDQWLYSAGQPALSISWHYDPKEKLLSVEGKQLQEKTFYFPLTLKISNAAGNSKKEKLYVDNRSFSFKIKTDKKPTSIVVDPDTELLMSATIKEK